MKERRIIDIPAVGILEPSMFINYINLIPHPKRLVSVVIEFLHLKLPKLSMKSTHSAIFCRFCQDIRARSTPKGCNKILSSFNLIIQNLSVPWGPKSNLKTECKVCTIHCTTVQELFVQIQPLGVASNRSHIWFDNSEFVRTIRTEVYSIRIFCANSTPRDCIKFYVIVEFERPIFVSF